MQEPEQGSMNRLTSLLSSILGRLRFNAWASILAFVTIMISIVFFVVHAIEEETEHTYDRIAKQASIVAQHIAVTAAGALVRNDYPTLEDDLRKTAAISDLLNVHIVNLDGKMVAHIDNGVAALSEGPEHQKLALPSAAKVEILEDRVSVWKPIEENGTRLGWVQVDYGLDEIYAFERRFVEDNLIDGIFVALFGGVLFFILFLPMGRSLQRGVDYASKLGTLMGREVSLGIGPKDVRDLERALNNTSKRLKAMSSEQADTADFISTVLDHAADAVITIDSLGLIQTFNPEAERLFGYSEEEVYGRNLKVLMPEPYRSAHDGYLRRFMESGESHILNRRVELEGQHKKGAIFSMELSVGQLLFQGESHFVGTIRDITERKATENALNQSKESLAEAQHLARLSGWEWDIASDKVSRDETTYHTIGLGGLTELGTMEDVLGSIHPDDQEYARESFRRALSGEDSRFDAQYRLVLPNGESKTVHGLGVVRRNEAGEAVSVLGTVQDVTERSAMEDALRRSERSMANAQRVAGFGSWEWDIRDGQVTWSDAAYDIYGVNQAELEPSYDVFIDCVHLDDRAKVESTIVDSFETGKAFFVEHRIVGREGKIKTVRTVGEIEKNTAGNPVKMVGTVLDVTDYKAAEEQKQQSQKMAAVGQLASGVAHEFNNLLVAIGGFAQMAVGKTDDQDRVKMCLDEIVTASDRAAELTNQLLTFSRKRTSKPKTVKADDMVAGIQRLLGPLLGAKIALKMTLECKEAHIRVDPGLMSQAITNLAINARDAMPDGGTLTIATKIIGISPMTAKTGDSGSGVHVCVSVSDTGTGIDPAHLPNLFEPFFTTKEEGKGTGLGLSMVYTTATESGGHIDVESELGKGTTFNLYIPLAESEVKILNDGKADQALREVSQFCALVVEDDKAVRQLAVMALEEVGYFVLEAEDGEVALSMVRESIVRMDLIVSDLELPGMGGVELVRALLDEDQYLKIVIMSGYDIVEEKDEIGRPQYQGQPFLKKPFKPEALQKLAHDMVGVGQGDE